MERDRNLSLIVGGFVLATLAVLAVVILSLSSERGFFRPQYRLVAHFGSVLGLLPNAPVWLAGKEVGRVESVGFTPLAIAEADRAGGPPLEVVIKLDAEVQELVRADSIASIGTIGVLGDSYVEIGLGTLGAPILEDGEEIRTVTPVSMNAVFTKGEAALVSITEFTENLNDVVASFGKGRGGARAAEAVAAASDMLIEIREGQGLLHSVIYDSYEGGGVKSIEQSLAHLENILEEVRSGEGVLHSLIYDSPSDQDVVIEVIEAGARLNSILGKIDRGEGTLGMLLNDPSLYEDVKILVGGAQRSAVLRALIRAAADSDE